MAFRYRIALFFIAILVAVQLVTAALVYQATRHELIEQGQRQLDGAAQAFARQLDDIAQRVGTGVQVLSLDYALRAAIAQHDEATLLSALRNHAKRVGAARMLVVDVAGKVEADSRNGMPAGSTFPYPELTAAGTDTASDVVALDGKVYWMVVTPVFAPTLVGYIAAAIPIDDAVLARLQGQFTLPDNVELVLPRQEGWQVVARGSHSMEGLATALLGRSHTLPSQARTLRVGGREFVARAVRLDRDDATTHVAAVLGYSVDEALAPYRRVALVWAIVLGLGLMAGLGGAWVIARGISRPVERLAALARRISAGDYRDAEPVARRDEIGQLANAFVSMTASLREREARILHQAGHDPVTGLANRLSAENDLRRCLSVHAGQPLALLLIGPRRHAELVRTLGHEVADRVMCDAGQRLRAISDDLLLARVTDAQFCLLLPHAGAAGAGSMAAQILRTLDAPYREGGLSLDLAPAVGIALAPQDGDEAGILLRHADVALMRAMDDSDPIAFYEADADPHRAERLVLMGDLRHAIEHGGLHMHYQPKLDLPSGRVDGAEALARWRHPRQGAIGPDVFIPLAEETGNIRRLTRWALATGVAQAAQWRDLALDLRVAVNVSALDLDDRQLPGYIAGLLVQHRLPADRLLIEITESAIMHHPTTAMEVLAALSAQGLALAIDDFGVGQSSLAYLRQLPVHELKIDRSFVTRLGSVREDRSIVRAIVELGHDLGYTVTAEGVEDARALDYLAEVGCDHVQGYFVSPPVDVDRFQARYGAPHAAPGARP